MTLAARDTSRLLQRAARAVPDWLTPFNSIVITCFQRTAIIGILSMNGHHHGPFTERRYGKHDNGTNTGYTRYHLSETPLPKTVIIQQTYLRRRDLEEPYDLAKRQIIGQHP